ncbi:ABC transporter related protein [Dehalogenimonas lykanthroporepellens BL-DC-9]|nr:ABC transporter related protein [Dehalogenimonas lykanthroporepellens BL-DC-9]
MFTFDNIEYGGFLKIPALDIEERRITTLIGPSGSGKTTILRLLNKMISPTRGRINWNGQDLALLDSVAHRRRVVLLSQNPAVFPGTLEENLNAGLVLRREQPANESRLKGVLEQVGLDKPLDAPAGKLSGGEKQRMALARVLLLDPEVCLLDEPSSSLDEETAVALHDMLARYIKESGKTMVLVTHSGTVAEKYSDVIIDVTPGGLIGGVSRL